MAKSIQKLALIVRQGPFQGRSGRDQLDMALSAAALGIELELVFTASGLLQLLPGDKQSEPVLPGSGKGWKSLPGLTRVHAWSRREDLETVAGQAGILSLKVQAASRSEISARLDRCDRVLVL